MGKIMALLSMLLSVLIVFTACEDKDENFISDNVSTAVKKVYKLNTLDNKVIDVEVKEKILEVKNKELQNQVILVNFWATWCPPCRVEIPHFVKVVDKYKGKFNILGVLLETKERESIQEFVDEYGINYPIIIGDDNFHLSRAISNTRSLPFSVLYDAKGNYVTSYVGAIPQEMLELDIEKALKR